MFQERKCELCGHKGPLRAIGTVETEDHASVCEDGLACRRRLIRRKRKHGFLFN